MTITTRRLPGCPVTTVRAGQHPDRGVRTLHNVMTLLLTVTVVLCSNFRMAIAAPLLAGVAKVDITNVDAGPVNDPLYAKALVLKSDSGTVVIITVDAVAVVEAPFTIAEAKRRLAASLGVAESDIKITISS